MRRRSDARQIDCRIDRHAGILPFRIPGNELGRVRAEHDREADHLLHLRKADLPVEIRESDFTIRADADRLGLQALRLHLIPCKECRDDIVAYGSSPQKSYRAVSELDKGVSPPIGRRLQNFTRYTS
jgi:hypothetical protein